MIVVGADEVGRGALAGSLLVCAAAFNVEPEADPRVPGAVSIMPAVQLDRSPVKGVKDSKRFSSESARRKVAALVAGPFLTCPPGFGIVEAKEINEHGMTWAWKTAFTRALDALLLGPEPFVLLVDGDVPSPVPAHLHATQFNLPKADNLWWPVAAASILAKVKRDGWMSELHKEFPAYGFISNKGYGTPSHIQALREHGPCYLHRTQFVDTALGRSEAR